MQARPPSSDHNSRNAARRMSRAGQLRINREQVDAPGTGNHGLSAAAGTGARPDQIVGPVPVDRDQVARLTLAESLVAGEAL